MKDVGVLLVQRAFRPAMGGASRRLEELAVLLAKHRGVGARIITLDDNDCNYPSILEVQRLRGDPLKVLARWKMVVGIALAIGRMKKKRKVLYINAPFVECGLLVLFARNLGVRVVLHLTLMGQDAPSDLERRSRYPGWLTRWLVKCLGKADLVLTMGDALREDAILYGWPAGRLLFLPHPKDETLYHPVASEIEKKQLRRSFGLKEDVVICGFVGFLVPRKGIEELVDAWKSFHRCHPETQLAICGPIEEYIKEWADNVLTELDPESFVYLGSLSAERVGEFLRCLDIFVFPSRQEGLPSALVEAMMTGLACVVTGLRGSTAELIDDELSGLLVPPRSPKSIVDAMERLVLDSALRKFLGQEAYARTEFFRSSQSARNLLRIILGGKIADPDDDGA